MRRPHTLLNRVGGGLLVPLAACLLALPAPAAAQATDWRQIQKPPLRAFQPQQPRRLVLPNGMVVFLQEDRELPLVRGFARIRGGSREEPADKAGLVSIYGQVWRTGGTSRRSGDDLDDFLEARGARVETGGGLNSTTISFNTLKESFDEVFQVFSELLRDPAFRDDKIVLARNQINTSIARRNDNPAGIAAREARKLGYGAESPYARVPEYATVSAVNRDDLVKWHRGSVHPNNILLGIVGDFDMKQMEALLRRSFAAWPRGPAAAKAEIPIRPAEPGIYFVQKDDVNQSNIRMVHLGTRRDNPDFHALEVMNEVFGGGFSGRLLSNIRSRQGLAYSVGGGVGANFDHAGLFQVSMGTASEQTAAAIEALYREIEDLHRNPPTAEELARAKESILNSFIFRYDSRDKVLSEKMLYEFYGYPADFMEKYRARIERVTAADVERVARKYVHRDRIALLVVGKAEDFDKPLSTFGPVTTLDITIPEPGAPTRDAPTASDAGGEALLAKVIEGLGGRDAVKAVRSFRQTGKMQMMTPQGEMSMALEVIAVLPDRLWQRVMMPMGTMTAVVSPDGSFLAMPQGTQEMPASQKEATLRELRTNPLYVAQRAGDGGLVVRASGTEQIGNAEAQVLELTVQGAATKWWIDPQSGRILRSASRGTGMGPSAEQVVDYSDWRQIGGVTLAFKRTLTRDGQPAGSVEIKEAQINPEIDSQLFARPN
jgi:zinc protease